MGEKSMGIDTNKCPRCSLGEETWEHIWICSKKNGADDTEYNIFINSIDEVLSNIESDEVYNEKDIVRFKDRIMELAEPKI
jgi:hypothetical protein